MKKELHVVVENAMTATKESLDRYTKSFAATFVQA